MSNMQFGEIPKLIRHPAVYQFPDLPTLSPAEGGGSGNRYCGKWGWHRMEELDQAVSLALKNTQHPGPHERFVPDYETFDPVVFSERDDKGFVRFFQSKDGRRSSLDCDTSISDLTRTDFFNDELYVPAGWGCIVLRLAEKSIVRVERRGAGEAVGIMWQGTIVSYISLMLITAGN